MLERSVERKLVREAEKRGALALKGEKLGSGYPDRILLARVGRIAFAELKAPGEEPTDIQDLRIRRLRGLGFRVEVLDHPDQVVPFLEDWLA